MGDVIRSSRGMDWGWGLVGVAGGLVIVTWADGSASLPMGSALVVLGALAIARPRSARIHVDAIEVQTYFRRRRVPWGEMSAVRVQRQGPFRQLVIELADGRDLVPEGITAFRARGTPIDAFAARATGLASGPPRQPPEPMSRRRRWVVFISFGVVLLGLAVSLASGN